MNIARPIDGFKVVETQRTRDTLNQHRDTIPWLKGAYTDTVAHLRMVGHIVGTPSKYGRAHRNFIQANPVTRAARLAVSYHVLGDTLTILAIKVLV